MEVDEYAGLTEDQRKKAIAKRGNADRKKVIHLQVVLENKERKEAEHVAKLEEKEKEKQKEKEEKANAKGKKKEEGAAVILMSSTID